MVDHQVIDLFGIDDVVDAVHQLAFIRLFDGVNQGDLLVNDEKGVVGGAAIGGITVKITDVPVDSAHPVDIVGELYRFHGSKSSRGKERLKGENGVALVYEISHGRMAGHFTDQGNFPRLPPRSPSV